MSFDVKVNSEDKNDTKAAVVEGFLHIEQKIDTFEKEVEIKLEKFEKELEEKEGKGGNGPSGAGASSQDSASLAAQVNQNTVDIINDAIQDLAQDGLISDNDTAIGIIEAEQITQNTNISNNAGNITILDTAVSTNGTNISTNTTDIGIQQDIISADDTDDWLRAGYGAAPSATGTDWTAIGDDAGNSTTTSVEWTAVGKSAGHANITGNNWTSVGSDSGRFNTVGDNWTAIGYQAGRFSSGSRGVFIGKASGDNLTTGNDCISIGADVDFPSTTASGQLVIGDFITRAGTSDTAKLAGDMQFTAYPDTRDDAAGTVVDNFLHTDVNGVVKSSAAIVSANSAGNWVRAGYDAAPSATGTKWTAIGHNAGNLQLSGESWVAIGRGAGSKNTASSSWTAVGYNAGFNNASGQNWTAIGRQSGNSNTAGSGWTAIGYRAGYVSTGGNNTFIGNTSGGNLTTGDDCISIGANISFPSTTASDQIVIGDIISRASASADTKLAGDYEFTAYPNTRDDSATETPANILYTDANGVLMSAPNAVLFIGAESYDYTTQTKPAAATLKTITFDTNGTSNEFTHTTGTGVFVCQTVGKFLCTVHAEFETGGGGAGKIEMQWQKSLAATPTTWVTISGSPVVDTMPANDDKSYECAALPLLADGDSVRCLWATDSTAIDIKAPTSLVSATVASAQCFIQHAGGI